MDATLENSTENDVAAAENDISGSGADNDITGEDNDIEENIDETKENLDGTEEDIDGAGNIPNGGTNENAIDGATKNAEENQQEHGENMAVNSDEKKWPGWPGMTVFRVLVPYHRVGGLIGKKGDIIKKISEETKTRIKVLDAPSGAPERAVIISAKEEPGAPIPPAIDGLLRVHKRIIDGLAGEPLAASKAGNPEVTRLLAGASQTGTLIGKHGANIKSIQEASNCIIRVIEDVPPFALQDDRVVEVQGEPTDMHKALELIASHLRKYLVDRSVVPIFEMQMSGHVSHMQHNMPPPQPWGPPQGPQTGGPGFNQNPHYMPPRSHDNYYPQHEMPPPYEKPPHHGISTFGRDVPPMGGHPSNNQINQGTQYMQVPISFADAVIGAAGANISYIRRTSGATITIQESRGVAGEMTVEINGSATQVQIAQQLIQNFMAEAGAPAVQSTGPPPSEHAYNSTSSYAPPPAYGSSGYASSTYAAAAPPVAAPTAGAGYGGAYASNYNAGYGY